MAAAIYTQDRFRGFKFAWDQVSAGSGCQAARIGQATATTMMCIACSDKILHGENRAFCHQQGKGCGQGHEKEKIYE